MRILAARGEDRYSSATFFAAQVDFTKAGDLMLFIDDAQLKSLEEMMAERGYLDGARMATVFNMLRPKDLIWPYIVNNYMLGKKPFPFDLLFWNQDSTRMTPANHKFYLREFYHENKLARGQLTIGNVRLDLGKVKLPIYELCAKEDHIAPAKSVFIGSRLFGGPVTYVLAGSGHIAGVINPPGEKIKYQYWTNDRKVATLEAWFDGADEHPGSWWPHYADWLAKHSGDKVPARTPGAKPRRDRGRTRQLREGQELSAPSSGRYLCCNDPSIKREGGSDAAFFIARTGSGGSDRGGDCAADAAVCVAAAGQTDGRAGVGQAREPHAHRRVQGAGRDRLPRCAQTAGNQTQRCRHRYARQSWPIHRTGAARAGVPCTIFVPEGNSRKRTRRCGPSAPSWWSPAPISMHAGRMRRSLPRSAAIISCLRFIADLVKGVATYALELFRAVADLDAVYVPIGMGSGICGLITVRDLLGLRRTSSAWSPIARLLLPCRLNRSAGVDQFRGHLCRWHGLSRSRCRADRHHMPWRGAHRARDRRRDR